MIVAAISVHAAHVKGGTENLATNSGTNFSIIAPIVVANGETIVNTTNSSVASINSHLNVAMIVSRNRSSDGSSGERSAVLNIPVPVVIVTDVPIVVPVVVVTNVPVVVPVVVIADIPVVVPVIIVTNVPIVFPIIVIADIARVVTVGSVASHTIAVVGVLSVSAIVAVVSHIKGATSIARVGGSNIEILPLIWVNVVIVPFW